MTGAHAPKTMSAVLNDLVERDRVEAEEAQRVLMSVYNGLAGVALLQGRKRDAVAWYGKVLEHVRENAGVCAVDRLQQMHALTNLGALRCAASAACAMRCCDGGRHGMCRTSCAGFGACAPHTCAEGAALHRGDRSEMEGCLRRGCQ